MAARRGSDSKSKVDAEQGQALRIQVGLETHAWHSHSHNAAVIIWSKALELEVRVSQG